ncbi:DUF397 domain-containing protein [Streptomyces hirsutus]|uniref:DUF397 domain-containing protein n=1 Tax=Streptomyces hirsutus TaxID=35620 RepID=UPI0036CBA6D2
MEAADLPAAIAVRDSKDKQGPALVFPRSSWSSFVTSVSTGDITIAPTPDPTGATAQHGGPPQTRDTVGEFWG